MVSRLRSGSGFVVWGGGGLSLDFVTDGYSCMLGLLCFLLDSVGWVPMRSSGFHFQVDEVSLSKSDSYFFFSFELLSDFFYYCQKRDDKISCVGCQYWIANKIGSIHFVSPSHWRRHYRRFSPSDTDFCKVWSSLYS